MTIKLEGAGDELRFKIDLASKCVGHIREAQRNHTESLLALGQALYAFDHERLWQYIPDPENSGYGFASFDKWLRSDADLSYSTCRLAMQAYDLLIVEAEYEFDEIAEIPVGKIQVIVPEIKAIYEQRDRQINEAAYGATSWDEHMANIEHANIQAKEAVAGWVADAAVLSRPDLKRKRVEDKGGRVWQGLLCVDDVPEHLRDRFDPDVPIQTRFMQLPE